MKKMKRLACEICGSNDFLKKDGVYECQSCGIKFSVEEARKMVVDVNANSDIDFEFEEKHDYVQPFKEDDITNIDALIRKAKSLYKEGKTDEAYTVFGQVLHIDAENYIATIYRGLCSAWNTTIANVKIGDSVKVIIRGLEIAKKELGETKEFAKFSMEIAMEVYKISSACMNLFKEQFITAYNQFSDWAEDVKSNLRRSGIYADIDWYKKRTKEAEEKLEKETSIALDGIRITLTVTNLVMMKIILVDNVDIYTARDYEKLKTFIMRYMTIPSKYIGKEADDYKNGRALVVICEERIKQLKDKKREKYWEEHKFERESIEKEIEFYKNEMFEKDQKILELKEEKKEFSKKINSSVPTEKELYEQLKLSEQLNQEKSALKFFNIKGKKEIKHQLAEIEEKIKQSNKKVCLERDELKRQYQPCIKIIEKEIDSLEREIELLSGKIDAKENELKRDRD